MIWNDHSRDIPDGSHAFLSPSTHSWINYTDEKLLTTYINKLATLRGTLLHETACDLIKLKILLPDVQQTLNMYVNDCIHFRMEPEKKLYYSKYAFGTADAIYIEPGLLRISDLKTGKTKTSFLQLIDYAALFFLEYSQYKPAETKIELRIYQNNECRYHEPEIDEIVPIMDKNIRFTKILEELEEKYDEGFGDLS